MAGADSTRHAVLFRESVDGRARGVGARRPVVANAQVRRPRSASACAATRPVLREAAGVRSALVDAARRRRHWPTASARMAVSIFERHYSWPVIERKYLEIFERLAADSVAAGMERCQAGWLRGGERCRLPRRSWTGCRGDRSLDLKRDEGSKVVKFAFVTPRYGGNRSGAEHACRLLAEQLGHRHDIDVLTTRRASHGRGGTIRRRRGSGPWRARSALPGRISRTTQPGSGTLSDRSWRSRVRAPKNWTGSSDWGRRRPGCSSTSSARHRSYDALVFFSLSHWTTVHGLAIAPERSILFPHLRSTRRCASASGPTSLCLGARRRPPVGGGAPPAAAIPARDGRHEEVVGIGVEPLAGAGLSTASAGSGR